MLLKTLTIAKALKRKNKLTGEIKQIQTLIQQENRIKEGKERSIDIIEKQLELGKKITELISIKSAISKANNLVVHKIYQLSEYKSLIKFLQSIPTEKGEEKESLGYTNIEKVNYTVIIDKKNVLEQTEELQTKIDNLQEELDRFNFTTDITYDTESIVIDDDLPF